MILHGVVLLINIDMMILSDGIRIYYSILNKICLFKIQSVLRYKTFLFKSFEYSLWDPFIMSYKEGGNIGRETTWYILLVIVYILLCITQY